MDARPVLKLKYTPRELLLEGISAFFLLSILVLVATNWSSLPEQIPIHFGIDGRPDGFGGKSHILMLPGIAFVLFIVMSLVIRFPHKHNFPWNVTSSNAEQLYRLSRELLLWVKIIVVGVNTYLVQGTLETIAGSSQGLSPFFLILAILAPVSAIYWFYKRGSQIIKAGDGGVR